MTGTLSTPAAAVAAQRYLDAWNAHDASGVLATFAPGGTYVDPTLAGPIGGEHLVGYVAALVAAFPDLHFDVEDVAVDGDRVIARWRMRGTNTGPLPGAPEPTGGSCALPGVDVITVGEAGITAVVGYFDQKTFVEQLGLQAFVVPADEPPMAWGYSVRTDLGDPTVPGALSMTWTDVGSDAEAHEVQIRSRQIVQELAAQPGFIAWLGTGGGTRMHTVTAWTDPRAAEAAVAGSAAHREAVERVRRDGMLPRGFTGIWVPYRLNAQQTDCPECGTKVWFDAGTSPCCVCGYQLTVGSYL